MAAVKAAVQPEPVPSQKPRVPTARPMTIGTKIPEMRSASRCTWALPFWASSTRCAIWASWVSLPMRVARTTSRPPEFTVAPTTRVADADLDGHGLTGEHRGVDRGRARGDDAVGRDLLAGADDELVTHRELLDRDADLLAVAQDGDVLGAHLEQGAQGGAGLTLGPGLGIAPGQQEGRHPGRGLEIDVAGAVGPLDGEAERVGHAGRTGRAEEERVERPPERGQRPDRDEGVHRRRAVPQVDPGSAVERPGSPDDDGCGEGQRRPLPVGELERRDHRHRDDRHGEHQRDEQPVAQGPRRVGDFESATGPSTEGASGAGGRLAAYPACSTVSSRYVGRDGLGVLDPGLLGGVVDRRDDAVELVELALDPVGARRAGHPGDVELNAGGHWYLLRSR